MTTTNANTEGRQEAGAEDTDLDQTAQDLLSQVQDEGAGNGDASGNVLTGQGDDGEADDDALLAGWNNVDPSSNAKAATTGKTEGDDGDQEITFPGKQAGEDEDSIDGGEDGELDQQGTQKQEEPEDPEIPGLGMRASEVRTQLAAVGALQKQLASANGKLGHLQQLVQQAGQGKPVTKEALQRVSVEFGEEFAEALATDLSAAGFGGGHAVSADAIAQMVHEQFVAAKDAMAKDFEERLVLKDHPDAHEHFSRPKLNEQGEPVLENGQPVWVAGPKNAAFLRFVGTLPEERQRELANSWDSRVIGRALTEFKAHERQVAQQQTTQTARTARAVMPNTGRGGGKVPLPSQDPMEVGWNKVAGGKGNMRHGGARR